MQSRRANAAELLRKLEHSTGGRLGYFAKDTASGRTLRSPAAVPFPMCSTFKTLAAGAVLRLADQGRADLAERIEYTEKDLLDHSPVTRAHVAEGGMTLGALCEAALTEGDNTAANAVLARAGGPAAVTAWLREIGDSVTRIDRNEPFANTCVPSDPRDTTQPWAMGETLERLTLGSALSPKSRARLVDWMVHCNTGSDRIRAGVPTGWRVADRTGAGQYGTFNDVGLAWPPSGKPVVLALYLTESLASDRVCNAAIARATGVLIAAVTDSAHG